MNFLADLRYFRLECHVLLFDHFLFIYFPCFLILHILNPLLVSLKKTPFFRHLRTVIGLIGPGPEYTLLISLLHHLEFKLALLSLLLLMPSLTSIFYQCGFDFLALVGVKHVDKPRQACIVVVESNYVWCEFAFFHLFIISCLAHAFVELFLVYGFLLQPFLVWFLVKFHVQD